MVEDGIAAVKDHACAHGVKLELSRCIPCLRATVP